MATTMSDAMKMYRIVKKYGTFYMVNWPITWNPGLQTVKRMVDDGAIGKVIEIKTRMGHTGPSWPRREAQDRGDFGADDRGGEVQHMVAPA